MRVVAALPTELRGGGPDTRWAARKAYPQPVPLVACSRERQGAPSPLVHLRNRPGSVDLEEQGNFVFRTWKYLQGHVEENSERSHCSRHQAREVVARDVFHDLAAKGQDVAFAVEEAHAQHEVPDCAGVGAARSRLGGSHRAAESVGVPEAGRFEGEHLGALFERRLDLAQGGSAARGDHELGGLVADDAAVSADVQRAGLGRAPEKSLAAAADDG